MTKRFIKIIANISAGVLLLNVNSYVQKCCAASMGKLQIVKTIEKMRHGTSELSVEKYLESVGQSYRLLHRDQQNHVLQVFVEMPKKSSYVTPYKNILITFDSNRKLVSVSSKMQYMGL